MKTSEVVRWNELRPNEVETSMGVCGLRVRHHGMRMEVRLEDTITDGLHVSWKVCDSHHRLTVVGRIPFMHQEGGESFLKKGMERAIKFAELWCELES